MGQEWVKLNTAIVRMTPDDVLRGLSGYVPSLQFISKHCDFVGYGSI